MDWYKEFEQYDEMKKWFVDRTDRHVGLVKKYCKLINDYDPDRFEGIMDRSKVHDESKYEDPEKESYIFITWSYKCKDDGKKFEIPEYIKERMSKATEHHVKNNAHHPEYHSDKEVGLINREDRDKPPEEMIDATKMENLDLGEMTADWLAMSEEKGTNPKDWAKKNVNVRWKFNEKQEALIYELIENIWE